MELVHTAMFINSIWVGSTFLLGFAFKRIGMPPMLGFLASGFLMSLLGLHEGTLALGAISDLGIYLLLFTIGLKLNLKGLARPEIWGGATIHALLTILATVLLLLIGRFAGITFLDQLSPMQLAIIGFALSFSSTVFAVKILDQKGEMNSIHGQVAIGILIMQDLMAVLFLTISKGQLPSLWVFALPIFLLVVRPLLEYIMDHVGHGELLPMSGLFIVLIIGTTSFAFVGLKPDLGALLAGVLIGSHPRSHELSASLYSFKDVFLVGFFFQVGLTGIPEIGHIIVALLLVCILPLKSFIYFIVFTRFHLRARTGLLATLSLSNYSEFGLLVSAIAMKNGWLSADWLIIFALALTFSFIASSPINIRTNIIYKYYESFLRRFETDKTHPGDISVDLGNSDTLIFGLGAFGTMAYDTIQERLGDKVLAVDLDKKRVRQLKKTGRTIVWGDATDYDFWHLIDLDKIKLVILAMTNHQANMLAIKEMKSAGYDGPITATAQFEDERLELIKVGATAAYNIFSEAGAGYADHVCKNVGLVCKENFIPIESGIPNFDNKE